MIATRQPRRRRAWGRLLAVPLVAAGAAGLLAVPPVHRIVFNERTSAAISTATAPLSLAAQVRTTRERESEIARLHDQLRADQARMAERDAHAKQLQQTIDDLQTQLTATRERGQTAPHPMRSADPFAAGGGDADARRTAAYWAAMDPDRAAAVVQKAPEDFAVRVFSAMPADAAGAILGALPPALAARLSAGTTR